MTTLIDCHAHIHDPAFRGDLQGVLQRARDAGVAIVVTAGTDLATSAEAVELAERESGVRATVGIHPHEASLFTPDDPSRFAALARSKRVVAIGEIGLDYHYDHSPREVQRQVFQRQLEMADELELPVVIHSRDADADTLAILSAWTSGGRVRDESTPRGMMHCYAYGPGRVKAYTALGLLISISGIVTYPSAAETRDAATSVSLDALLLETDCPYLAPQSRRGKRNEPALVAETAAKVAFSRGITFEELAVRSTANASLLFRLKRDAPGDKQSPSGAGQSSKNED